MRVYSQVASCALFFGLGALGFSAQISPLQCSNPGSTTASQSDTTIHANSCTDFSYLNPNSQSTPTNNWLYGYYHDLFTPSSFTPMTQQLPQPGFGWWAVDFTHVWTSLDAFGGHPNSVNTDLHDPPYCDPVLGDCGSGPDTNPKDAQDFVGQWAVRRYVVPLAFNGTVLVTVSVQKDYRTTAPDSDGDINLAILYDSGTDTQYGSIVTPPNPALLVTPANFNTFPIQTEQYIVPVHGGDFLDFAIAPGLNDYSDGEFQLITIVAIPEPGTVILVGGGLLLAGFVRRRYTRR